MSTKWRQVDRKQEVRGTWGVFSKHFMIPRTTKGKGTCNIIIVIRIYSKYFFINYNIK